MRAPYTRGRLCPIAVLLAALALPVGCGGASDGAEGPAPHDVGRARDARPPDHDLRPLDVADGRDTPVADGVDVARDVTPNDALGGDGPADTSVADVPAPEADAGPEEPRLCCVNPETGAWEVGGQRGVGSPTGASRRVDLTERGVRVGVYWQNLEPDWPTPFACGGSIAAELLPAGIYYFDIDAVTEKAEFVGGWTVPAQFWYNYYDLVYETQFDWDSRSCVPPFGVGPPTPCSRNAPPPVTLSAAGVKKQFCADNTLSQCYACAPPDDPPVWESPQRELGRVIDGDDPYAIQNPRTVGGSFSLDALPPDELARSGVLCGHEGEPFVDISGDYLEVTYESRDIEAQVGADAMHVRLDAYAPPPVFGVAPATEMWLADYLPLEDRTVVWIAPGGDLFWLELPGGTTGTFVAEGVSPLPPYSMMTPVPRLKALRCLLHVTAAEDWACQSDLEGGALRVTITEYGPPGGVIAGEFETTLIDRQPYLRDEDCNHDVGGVPPVRATGRFRVRRPL